MGTPLILILSFVCLQLVLGDEIVKHLAGPPSEFSHFILPLPQQQAQSQNSACFKLFLHPTSSDVLEKSLELAVDSSTLFQIAFFSPFSDVISLSLTDPHGAIVPLHGIQSFFPLGDTQLPGTLYTFSDPILGKYTFTVTTYNLNVNTFNTINSNTEADAYIILWNENSLQITSSLNSYSLLTGNQIGLVATLFDSSSLVSEIKENIESAELDIEFPDGHLFSEPMRDDGLNADGSAHDGRYGALVTATEAGTYTFTATFRGENAEGVSYVRSTTHIVEVVDPTVRLLGSASGVLNVDKSRINLRILAAGTRPSSKYRVYAEVWGVDKEGTDVPIAWVGGMTFLKGKTLQLELDLNWVSMASAAEPITLRNVVVQDPNTFIPLVQVETIFVKLTFDLPQVMSNKMLLDANGTITQEMREGKKPFFPTGFSDKDVSIILVHGYCAAHNSFEIFNNGSDWTNAKFYLDIKQNLPHDAYAINISRWAQNFGPYSHAGHSQGGAAGLHLKNYYFSGLDQVTGGRIIQSIGTPYMGSKGAGSAADLGKIFGATCGYNFDMTLDGAALWLNTITTENKKLVHYYTTTYMLNKQYDNCNALTQLILDSKNDGVTELARARLLDGKDEGNVEGWCHIGGMKYPPQVQNSPRNQLMNALSARTIL